VTTNTLRNAWEQIRAAAGLDEVRFHDLRHMYAVHCAKAGMPLGELQQRLGHASIQMTMRYAVYQPPMVSTHYDLALSDMGLAG
jgi:integrase